MRFLKTAFVASVLIIGCAPGVVSGKDNQGGQKTICITFDELPYANSFAEVDAEKLNDMILGALEKHEVKAAGFVVGSRIGDHFDIIGRWLNAGHRIGNETYTYQDFNDMETDQFLQDVTDGGNELEPMLSGFGQKPRFFRYPFLHYGDSPDKKAAARSFLEEYNVQVAHATIVVEDYLYNLRIEQEDGRPDSATYVMVRDEYLNHVLDEAERVEMLSMQRLSRHCAQILQLRANQLNALYLEDLLTALENAGYKFVSIEKALKDEVYELPEAYMGLRGVGYLDMLQFSDSDFLPAH